MRYLLRGALAVSVIIAAVMLLGRYVAPWTTPYMYLESQRLGDVTYDWVALEDMAPVMARSVVAAEDANFCTHWGFDMVAICEAIEDGGTRGASTLSQQCSNRPL